VRLVNLAVSPRPLAEAQPQMIASNPND
jgi:hypothetical protein